MTEKSSKLDALRQMRESATTTAPPSTAARKARAKAALEGAPQPEKPAAKPVKKRPGRKVPAKAKKRASKPAKARATDHGAKRALVVELLTRPEGVSASELMVATGWPSISVPAHAKAAGLTLRKDGRPARYFGSRLIQG